MRSFTPPYYSSLPSIPSSPTLSSSVLIDMELDSDSASLYSSESQSPGSTPSSSNLTTPSTSPTASAFLVEEQVQANPSGIGSASALHVESPTEDSSWLGLEHANCPPFDPSPVLLPASLACSEYEFTNNLATGPFAHLSPSLVPSPAASSGLGGSNVIYQTSSRSGSRFSKVIEPPRTPILNPMPGVSPPHLTMTRPALPPRPIVVDAHEPPPHLPALRSPTVPSTPRLAQSQGWAAPADHMEHSSTYLRKQRQWVRMNISYGLPEPRAVPPFRPVEHYRKQYVRTYPSTAPLRSNRMGALSRKVSFAPKTLSRGMWDPWRRSGALERAILFQRRKLRMYEDMQPREHSTLEGDQDEEEDSDGEDPENPEAEDEDFAVHYQSSESQGPTKDASDSELMRLCVKDGKRVEPSLATKPESPHNANTSYFKGTGTKAPAEHDLETMRLCVANGTRVAPPNIKPAAVPALNVVIAVQPNFAPRPIVVANLHAPRAQSPLSQSFFVPPPAAQARFTTQHMDDASTAKAWAWRKFTSMVF